MNAPDPVGSSALYLHQPLSQFLAKILKLESAPDLAAFARFNMHSPNTNFLRWLGIQLDTHDLFVTDILAKELGMCILTQEKLLILPKAVEQYGSMITRQDFSNGWTPLLSYGPGFMCIGNFDPLEPLPPGVPDSWVCKILIPANAYDYLWDHWGQIREPLRLKKTPTPPEKFSAQTWEEATAWAQRQGLIPREGSLSKEDYEALKAAARAGVPSPLRELRLKPLTHIFDLNYALSRGLFPIHIFQSTVFLAVDAANRESAQRQLRLKLSDRNCVLVIAPGNEITAELKALQEATLSGTSDADQRPMLGQ